MEAYFYNWKGSITSERNKQRITDARVRAEVDAVFEAAGMAPLDWKCPATEEDDDDEATVAAAAAVTAPAEVEAA